MEAGRWAGLGHGELSAARGGSRSEGRLLETDPGVTYTSEITQNAKTAAGSFSAGMREARGAYISTMPRPA